MAKRVPVRDATVAPPRPVPTFFLEVCDLLGGLPGSLEDARLVSFRARWRVRPAALSLSVSSKLPLVDICQTLLLRDKLGTVLLRVPEAPSGTLCAAC